MQNKFSLGQSLIKINVFVYRYAPESYEFGKFSHASDVWSFGVTLYEMYSRGDEPYKELTTMNVADFISSGGRLKMPEQCPFEVYQLMLACWDFNPQNRPTFEFLVRFFRQLHSNSSHSTKKPLSSNESEYICINDLDSENLFQPKEDKSNPIVFNSEQVSFKQEIGKGNFGSTHEAELRKSLEGSTLKVAANVIKQKRENLSNVELLNEFKRLQRLNHPSIVSDIIVFDSFFTIKDQLFVLGETTWNFVR